MKKLASLVVIASLLAGPVLATEIEVSGLSEQQVAELKATAAQSAAENAKAKVDGTAPSKTVQRVNEWVEIGNGVGAGLAAAAEKMGIVANQFATTPVGKLTIFIILWKMIGGDLVQLFIGLLFAVIFWPTFIYFYAKLWRGDKTVTYAADGKTKVSVVYEQPDFHSEDAGVYRLLGLVGAVIFVLLDTAIIFA